MLNEVELKHFYRTTPTGLYLIYSLAENRNVQFAFRALGISDDPPMILLGIQHHNYSLDLIRKSKELGLNVCSRKQLHAIGKSRGFSGRDVEDKFITLGLDVVPAKVVKAPLVAGCHADIECRGLRQLASRRLLSSHSFATSTIKPSLWRGWRETPSILMVR